MVRVLVVEPTVFGYDGITNVITNYFSHIDHDKIHMDVVTINPVSKQFYDVLKKYDCRNYILPYRNRNPIKYINELRKILRNGNYNLVHVHGCSATMAVEMIAAKLAGVRIRIAHSHNTTCDHIIVDKVLRPIFNALCNGRFACGKEAGEWMFPGKEFTVISNGVDVDKFQFNSSVREQFREKYELNGKIVIGHVGRFSEQKNHKKLLDIFVDYASSHSNAKLVLIGDGELKKEIECRVESENLDVLFVGLSDEVDKWLQAMDIIVFPSLFEGLPLVLIEAQAAGLPCVLSNTISPDTKITDMVEFLDLDDETSVWSATIDKLLGKTDRSTQKTEIRQAIQNAQFDIKNNCEKLVMIYQDYLDKE